MHDATIELRLGQPVPYPPAPGGVAQVDGLLRRNVELRYERKGRLCRRRAPAKAVAAWIRDRPLLPGLPDNPLGLGCLTRSKRFPVQ